MDTEEDYIDGTARRKAALRLVSVRLSRASSVVILIPVRYLRYTIAMLHRKVSTCRTGTPTNSRAGTHRRPRLAEHRQAALARRAERQSCAARFLDLRLHQLHSHHSGSQEAGREVSERAGRHRRSFRQIRKRKRHRKHSPHHSALRDRTSDRQRRGFQDLAKATPSTPGPRDI